MWECDTGIAYLVSGAPDWRTRRMTQIYDLSDPAHPVKIRDFGLPGQEPGATGAVPTELHGPISTGPQGNRVYFGYGTDKGGFLQIVDRDKLLNGPKEPTPENLRYPEISRMPMSAFNGAHTTFPMMDMPIAEFAKDKDGKTRDIVMIVDEAILNECGEPRQMVWFADVTTETRPMMISSYTVPEASGHFCERGGRFGSHSSNESMAPVYYKKMAFIAFFNAGVRALDIRDPYHPKEVGYFIPSITAATDKRCVTVDGKDRCKVAIQTNNVETDERGYIYIVDRANTGLHILELTGAARAVAGLPMALSIPDWQRKQPCRYAADRSVAVSAAVGGLSGGPARADVSMPRCGNARLARDRLAVSARRLAGGPRLPLPAGLRRGCRTLCAAEDRLLQLRHRRCR